MVWHQMICGMKLCDFIVYGIYEVILVILSYDTVWNCTAWYDTGLHVVWNVKQACSVVYSEMD